MKCNKRRLARLVAGVFSLALALVPVDSAQTRERNAAKDSEPVTQATLNEQLLEACRDGQIDDVKQLLEVGADVNAPVGDGVVARIVSGAGLGFLRFQFTSRRFAWDSGLPSSAIRFNMLHPIIGSRL